ncbi:hypothetical protein DE146DRAFT_145574 [Phaeosphaeria sp. MPI-PUGE-AT-0046c]|nr:hypothetical protein DE146DRAFT_145574 [Phaeosphaeria sp. MPI-PUGE-AT-0046c]
MQWLHLAQVQLHHCDFALQFSLTSLLDSSLHSLMYLLASPPSRAKQSNSNPSHSSHPRLKPKLAKHYAIHLGPSAAAPQPQLLTQDSMKNFSRLWSLSKNPNGKAIMQVLHELDKGRQCLVDQPFNLEVINPILENVPVPVLIPKLVSSREILATCSNVDRFPLCMGESVSNLACWPEDHRSRMVQPTSYR